MLVVTMAMVACASTRTQKSAGEQVDDSVTTGRVKSALIADPVTKAHQIDVEMFKGTVQLNGFVDTAASKERATEVAQGHQGCHRGSQQPHGGDHGIARAKRVRRRRRDHHQGEGGARRGSAHQGAPDQRRDARRRGAALGLRRQLGSEVDGRGAGPCGRTRQDAWTTRSTSRNKLQTEADSGAGVATLRPFCLPTEIGRRFRRLRFSTHTAASAKSRPSTGDCNET